MSTQQTQGSDNKEANVTVGAALVLYGYVVVSILKQSDAQLILPSSHFCLAGINDIIKGDIPAGKFVAPFLEIEIPLFTFYMLGPVVLLAIHGVLILHPRLLRRAAPSLQIMAV